MALWQKGQSGNRNGRPKGRKDKVSAEVRVLAVRLFDDQYWTFTRDRLLKGKLPPFIEAKLLAYAFGEPQSDKTTGTGLIVQIGFLSAPVSPQLTHLNAITTDADGDPKS